MEMVEVQQLYKSNLVVQKESCVSSWVKSLENNRQLDYIRLHWVSRKHEKSESKTEQENASSKHNAYS